MRICTCGKEKTETVFFLDEEEREFFHNETRLFLKWINEQIENEKSLSETVEESYKHDELYAEIDRLKKENQKLKGDKNG